MINSGVTPWSPRGFAAGTFKVKSCGKAHAWCSECRPAQADAQRKPKALPRQHAPGSCRNCGTCNDCIGLSAPEGMKVCRDCRDTKPLHEFPKRADTGKHHNRCYACQSELTPNRVVHKSRERFCAHCGGPFVWSVSLRRHCSEACRTEAAATGRQAARADMRLAALRAYSNRDPFCSCCGEGVLQFLALDHIDGGGHRQRTETGGGGFYTWLKKNGYPPGFRVLCHNCNMGRQLNGGICPHDSLVRQLLEV